MYETCRREDCFKIATTHENIKAVKKIRLLMMLPHCLAHTKQFLWMFKHKSAAARIVSKLLNFKQKQRRMGDESWVYGYDIVTQVQSFQWNRQEEPRKKKARQIRSNVKVLLTVFFDCNGVVHHEFLLQGHTVNKEYYLEVMR